MISKATQAFVRVGSLQRQQIEPVRQLQLHAVHAELWQHQSVGHIALSLMENYMEHTCIRKPVLSLRIPAWRMHVWQYIVADSSDHKSCSNTVSVHAV